MKKMFLSAVAVMGGSLLLASPAFAQQTQTDPDVFIGAQIGYHDLGNNPIGDDDGFIYGLYAGVDVPVGEVVFVGVEGNYNLGSNAIDSEYGIAGRLGAYVGDRAKVFVRGGWQEVDLDFGNLAGVALPAGFDDTVDDYLVGAGAEYAVSDTMSLRTGIDTIGFDSVRVTAGVQLNF